MSDAVFAERPFSESPYYRFFRLDKGYVFHGGACRLRMSSSSELGGDFSCVYSRVRASYHRVDAVFGFREEHEAVHFFLCQRACGRG